MTEQYFEKDDVVIIILKGYVRADTLPSIEAFFSQKVNEKKYRFIFDLSQVEWMGSMALGLIACAIRESLAHNTRVRLVNPNPKIIPLLQETSLLSVCHVYASIDKALESFR